MKILYIFLILCSSLMAEDFITKSEYAKMLYQNPRGIGCNKCHGYKGEGKIIATYKTYNKKTKQVVEKSLIAPQINNLDFKTFRDSVRNSKSIMPSYFLTDFEIQSLYDYIKTFNKDKK